MAARDIIAAHGYDIEPYEFWIATSLGCALYTQEAFERWPSIVPEAWHPVTVKPDQKRLQRCAADILRTALRCHYEGVLLRALLDQVLGVRFMSHMIDFVGYSPAVKMRLESLDVFFIGDKPDKRERRYGIDVDMVTSPIAKASQVMDLLAECNILPEGWAVVPPLTCVDPFYYDAYIPRSSNEMMPVAPDKECTGRLRCMRDLSCKSALVDHRRAPREAVEDTTLEAVTSTRTTLQLIAEVTSDDYQKCTILWIGLLWGVDESSGAEGVPPCGPWVPRSTISDPF